MSIKKIRKSSPQTTVDCPQCVSADHRLLTSTISNPQTVDYGLSTVDYKQSTDHDRLSTARIRRLWSVDYRPVMDYPTKTLLKTLTKSGNDLAIHAVSSNSVVPCAAAAATIIDIAVR